MPWLSDYEPHPHSRLPDPEEILTPEQQYEADWEEAHTDNIRWDKHEVESCRQDAAREKIEGKLRGMGLELTIENFEEEAAPGAGYWFEWSEFKAIETATKKIVACSIGGRPRIYTSEVGPVDVLDLMHKWEMCIDID